MRVLVLCYEYPPVGGGGGRVAAAVARGLAAKGCEVKVVTAGMGHLPRREVVDGVEVLRPRSFRRREDTCSVPEMAMYLATAFFPAVALCRRWRPDVVHAHFVVPTGALAWALRLATGVPYVLTAHLGDVPGGVPEQTDRLFRVLGPFIRPVWRGASAVTAVSGFVAGLARAVPGVAPRVVLNGIPMDGRASRVEVGQPVRIVMLGRLSVQKNPLLALRALAGIVDLDWRFEVIGEGPLGGEMRKLAVGLEERVEFRGWLDAAEVSERLAASDILLMTSTSEGMPMAAIEALRHGLAIVGSRIGGLGDVIEDGVNGCFCDLEAGDFGAALRALISDRGRLQAYREASLRKAEAFNLPDRVDDYEDVLRGVMERGGGR
jgi:glycosyltransferase involved in cell wall biosynthesis